MNASRTDTTRSLHETVQAQPSGQACRFSAAAESGLVVEEVPPTHAVVVERLRRRYRVWGVAVLFDGRTTWTAVCPGAESIVRQSPVALRLAVDAALSERSAQGRGRS